MDHQRRRESAIRAGVVAAVAGFATFLVAHYVWIVTIWFIAPIGSVIAAAGGVAVGAAYAELLPHLPPRPWRAFAVAASVGVILLPALVIAELRGPLYAFGPDGRGTLVVPGSDAAVTFVVGLLGVTTIVGASLGWLIARRRAAAGALAAASFAFALGPGHNIPLLGGTPTVTKEVLILASVVWVSSIVLVEVDARSTRDASLTRRAG